MRQAFNLKINQKKCNLVTTKYLLPEPMLVAVYHHPAGELEGGALLLTARKMHPQPTVLLVTTSCGSRDVAVATSSLGTLLHLAGHLVEGEAEQALVVLAKLLAVEGEEHAEVVTSEVAHPVQLAALQGLGQRPLVAKPALGQLVLLLLGHNLSLPDCLIFTVF